MSLRALWDGPAHRTWINHALLAIAYTMIAALWLRVVPAWATPAAFPAFYYLVREVEGILYYGKLGSRSERIDHLLDVLSPAAAAHLIAGLLWGLGLRWIP